MSNAGGPKRLGPQPGRGIPKRPAFPPKTGAAMMKKFVGRCNELEGHIFDCGQPKHADLCNTTMEEVLNLIRLNFKEGKMVARTIVSGKTITIKKLVKPTDGDKTDLKIWKAKIKNYVSKESTYEQALQRAYGLVLGQCTQNMLANLKSLKEFEKFDKDANLLALLKGVKSLVFSFDVTKSIPDALVMALKNFYKLYHPKTMADSEFLRIYKFHYDVIKQLGGRIGNHPGMLAIQFLKMKVDMTIASEIADNLEEASELAEEEFLACHFLRMLNWEKHGLLLMHLENQYTLGMDSYPKTLTEAYNLAINIKWKATPGKAVNVPHDLDGITLATDVEKTKKKDISTIKCFICNKFGHYQSNCPDNPNNPSKNKGGNLPETVNTTTTVPASDLSAVTGVTGKVPDEAKSVTNLNTVIVDGSEFNFLQSKGKLMIPKMWLLLDNQSTCGVISNKDMLRDVVNCNPAVMHSQGGCDLLKKKGMLGDLECFYFEGGIANIVSLAKISDKYRVTFDSANGNCFIVHVSPKKKIWFVQSTEGLYYHDTAASNGHATFTQLMGACPEMTFVDTVSENMEGFSQRQIAGAKRTQDAYKTLGFPSMRDFTTMVRDNLIRNCPITTNDIKNAHTIYGPGIASLKGKIVWQTPPPVQSNYIHIPQSIFDKNKWVILAGDIMYVAGMKFLITTLHGINLITSEYLPNQTKGNLKESLVTCESNPDLPESRIPHDDCIDGPRI